MSDLAQSASDLSTTAICFPGDTLEGARAIAGYIGKTLRQTQHLLEQNKLPAFMLGGRWNMRKSTYSEFVKRLEQEAMKREAFAVKRAAEPIIKSKTTVRRRPRHHPAKQAVTA